MNIYISSSWKNRDQVRRIAVELRKCGGHEVYDFTDPGCRTVPEIPPEKFPELFDPEKHLYSEYIMIPEYIDAVNCNRKAITRADLIILLLPCGNDSHADWALGVGMGKKSVVLGHPVKGERTPVHNWADAILDTEEEMFKYIDKLGNQMVDNELRELGIIV